MDEPLRRSLVRLRVVASIYLVAWIATPGTFIAVLIAEPTFATLAVRDGKLAAGFVALFFLCSLCVAVWMTPLYVWCLGDVRRRAGGAGASPIWVALLAFVMPYFPLGVFWRSTYASLAAVDGHRDEVLPFVIAWAGPLVYLPMLVSPSILQRLGVSDPPPAVVGIGTAMVIYGVTQILFATRVVRFARSSLLRPAVDAMRASHTEPVGGG